MENKSIALISGKTFFVLSFIYSILGFTQSEIPLGKQEKIFFDDFTVLSDNWPTVVNDAYTFLNYNSGSYFIKRPANQAKAVAPNFPEIKRNFVIKTSLKLGPVKDAESSIGVYFMFQSDLSGGLIFEINKKQSYRVSQYVNGQIIYLSGEAIDKGWVKNKIIKGINENNQIEIKAFKGLYEIWINGAFIEKVKIDTYKRGQFGLWLGPQTIAKCDYFYLFDYIVENQPDYDLQELQMQINALSGENDLLRDSLLNVQFKGGDKEILNALKIVEKQLGIMSRENQILLEKLESKSPEDASIDALTKLSKENQILRNDIDSLKDLNLRCFNTIDSLHETYYEKIELLESQIEKTAPETEENSVTEQESNSKKESDKKEIPKEEKQDDELIDEKKIKVKKSTAIFD